MNPTPLSQKTFLEQELQRFFGYGSFKDEQLSIIQNILAKKNTLVVMPTGGGKSLCYQLPAVLQEGMVIVISPLIALMKSQIDYLNQIGIPSALFSSALSPKILRSTKAKILNHEIKLLYIAPESFTKEESLNFFKNTSICFIAIDEAHCISEWGHDFRPEYRKLKTGIQALGDPPIIALTATATPKVQLDILKNLDIEDAALFLSSFDRQNLYYEIRPKIDTEKKLLEFIKSQHPNRGIVYCQNRKKVEEIAHFLNLNSVKALPYHAGLDLKSRTAHQDAFWNEKIQVVVATIAFGMGIDKQDLRYVIHYDAPKSLEGYYQETGRAGRDGLEAKCILFYSTKDILKLEKLNKDKPVAEREHLRVLLQEVKDYVLSPVCRRKLLLHYFGEIYPAKCNHCDNCQHPTPSYAAQDQITLAIQAFQQVKEPFSISHIVHILTGHKDPYVASHQHDQLPIFGQGKAWSSTMWTSILKQMQVLGFCKKNSVQPYLLELTDTSLAYFNNPYPVTLHKEHEYDQISQEHTTVVQDKVQDPVFIESLKQLRNHIAEQYKILPLAVFEDTVLEKMATSLPTTPLDISRMSGKSLLKAKTFGPAFIQLIKEYMKENHIQPITPIVKSTMAGRYLDQKKLDLIRQMDKRIPLEEIANLRQISKAALIQELEDLCNAGITLQLDYYINAMLDPAAQQEIKDYFQQSIEFDVAKACKDFAEDYASEEVRLMYMKILIDLP